jgi:hypothetical protein
MTGVSLVFSGTLTPNYAFGERMSDTDIKATHETNNVLMVEVTQELQLFDVH